MRAQKYSASLNVLGVTTASSVFSSSSITTQRLTTSSPSPPPHKVYESGEDLNADVLDDDDDITDVEEDDDDVEEDLEEDGDDDIDVRDDFLVGKNEWLLFHPRHAAWNLFIETVNVYLY